MSNTKTKTKLSFLILLILSLCLSAFMFIGQPLKASAAEGELTIAVQPQQSIRYASENADFYVEAAGGTAPYTYKWQWIGYDAYYDGGAWSDISDSDNATLTVAVTEDMSGNFYRCIITDSASATVTSEEAMLFVPYLPTINTNLSFAKGHMTSLDLICSTELRMDPSTCWQMQLTSDGQSFIDPFIHWKHQNARHYFLAVYPTDKFTAMTETATWNNESEHGLLVAVSDDMGLIYGQTINLQFSQMLTKVNLDLNFDGFATEPTVSEVRIYCGNSYNINYLWQEIAADAYTYDANEYSSFTQEGKTSWSSIVVPQTGVRRIEVEIDGTVYTYESAEDITLNSGKAVNLDLTVTSGNATVAATSTTESDWVTATLGHTFDANGKCDCGTVEISNAAFPDANFRTYIAENFDTDKDGLLSSVEIANVTELWISDMGITTLAGVTYFTNLDVLEAGENRLTDTALNFSMLTELGDLNLRYAQNLESLDVSGCTELDALCLSSCHSLASLDLSNNLALCVLYVDGAMNLTSLDLSANANLEVLDISNTCLTSLQLHPNADVYIHGHSDAAIQHCGVGYVNMNTLGLDLEQIVKVENGTLGADGWLKLDDGVTYFMYYTATGNADAPLPIFVNIHPVTNPEDDSPAHTFIDQIVSKDENGHYTQSCSTCRTGNEESAVAEHTIEYGYTTKYTNSQHKEYCTVCGYSVIETCTYSSECNEVCSECNLTTRLFLDWSVHSFVYTTYIDGDDDSSNDSHSATCEDCGVYIGEFCTYEFACTEACVCGRANPTAVAHTEMLICDDSGTHDKVCSVCEKILEENVGHVYAYAASGNVLTENCNADGCTYGETATLHAPENAVYDGDDNQAIVAYSENWAGGELTVTYSGTANDGTAYTGVPVKAGEVTASIALDGAMASVNYTVAKATNEWTEAPTITGWTYGEYENEPTATPKFGEVGLSSFSYRVKGTVAWTNNPPTDAGVYEMRTRVQATDNWELLETTIEFEIKKATLTADIFDFTPPANLNVCDGSAKESIVTVKEGVEGVGSVTVTYFKDGNALDGVPMAIGVYTVKIDVAEGANYKPATLAADGWTFVVDTPDDNSHRGLILKSNDDGTHDKLCTVCEKVIESGVVCSGTTTDDCDKGYKCSCGGYFGTKEHDFSGSYLSDADGHWHECLDCGATDTKLAHTPEDDDGSCLTAILCSACGYETTKGYMIHNFNNANLYDSEGHWHKCEICDVTAAKYDHSFTLSQKDGTHHWNKCEECDATDTKTLHTFNVLETDDTDHWNKCSDCDAIDEKIKHSATEDGDCKTEEKCSCGAVVIEAKNDHGFDNSCDTTCGNKGCTYTREITHTPREDDGDCTTAIKCSVCQTVTTPANAAHTGGTATCAAKAECTVCGTAYGNTLAHTPETDDGDCTTAIKCSVCQTVTTPANEAHTGGTATCQAKAICTVCGTAYGELDANNHGKTTFVYAANADGTTHTKKYECCGEIVADGEAHAYGTDNTCVCGAEKPVTSEEPETPIESEEPETSIESEESSDESGCSGNIANTGLPVVMALSIIGVVFTAVKRKEEN